MKICQVNLNGDNFSCEFFTESVFDRKRNRNSELGDVRVLKTHKS